MGMPTTSSGRPLPRITPVSKPLYEAASEGRLLLPHCPRDGFFFYPRNRCPSCLQDDWSWDEASGRGAVHAFTIDRVGHDPGQRERVPLVVAVIELAEGPRMTANVLECAPEDVHVGMEVEVLFEPLTRSDGESVTLVQFRPANV